MKRMILILTISIITLLTNAQENNDFSSNANSIKINELLPNTLTQINKIEGKEEKIVQINKSISQEDFDKICNKLKWIKKLSIDYDNPYISNIITVSNLKTLESLRIRNALESQKNPISLTPLLELLTLKEIDFYGTKISNTDALNLLVNLEKINFYNSNVSSIDFLEKTPLVKELTLFGASHTFANYEPLKNLKKLRILDISYNPQATDENLKAIQDLIEIKEISFSECQNITTLNFLTNCNKLLEISAINCKNIIQFDALQDAILLKRINLSGTTLSTLDILSNKTELRELTISYTQITDISKLDLCSNIEKLDISNTSISDISVLSKLLKIKKLQISKTEVASISALSPLTDLTDLDISNTKVTEITGLSTCKKIANLSIINTQITDIKPLYSMDKLISLECNNLIPQAQIEALKVRFPLIRINKS